MSWGWLPDLARAAGIAAVLLLALAYWRRWSRRAALRAVHRFRARVDRFKLTGKRYIVDALLGDEVIAAAVDRHASEHGRSRAEVWRTVRRYLDEIVPAFNLLMYYRFGYAISKAVVGIFYKVSVEHERPAAIAALPRESIVVYLMNHRSNADYVVASYALAGQVAISYAVGEWARVFPLEYLFKSFGSYFIRRRYREPLYHTVLERYVQLITRNGVTQGIFPEGGLTRDGRLRPVKVGLLDYLLGTAREPGFAERMYIVPVAINYDRVLEDRSLLSELRQQETGRSRGRWRQLREVVGYVVWNAGRALTRQWKRYGRVAVVIGAPVPVRPWLEQVAAEGAPLWERERSDRLAQVQRYCDTMMERIGALIPVTAVPLACAALQTFDAELVTRAALLERMAELRAGLIERGARVLRAESDVAESLERAERMLTMRRVLAREGERYVILPRGRELISYYANSIAHLLGDFEQAVHARDALPADGFIGR
ncbi:MAG: 1-acyl-sn-glycerol-3-phosphate acyltransferase [Gemmatimonadaceae bacterium]|nr:1-acyl-sn-glycerol-3-phosphate acyltransferase [Gemmatimonadaceae bacterium]